MLIPFLFSYLYIVLFSPALASVHSSEGDDDLSVPSNAVVSASSSLLFGSAAHGSSPPDHSNASDICFCSYGEGICTANRTCHKHPLAQCFHATEERYNPISRKMERLSMFGCAGLERGSSGSHLLCNAWRSHHFHPRSIACCNNGSLCNKDLVPPPPVNLLTKQVEETEVEIRQSSPWIVVLSLFVLIFGIVLTVKLIYRFYRNHKKVRSYQTEEIDVEKEEMLIDESGSGSGSGNGTINQRTVANDLSIITVIGQGRFGQVRKAYYRGSYVAVKTFYTTEEQSWRNELDIYQTHMLNHENILQYVAADISSEDSITQMLLITDYHSLGSLSDYLRREESLSLQEALKLCHSSVCGIEHLHAPIQGTGSRRKPEIAHRDIKSKNIIVKRAGVCCVADFGLAVRLENNVLVPEKVNIQVGTKRYMAPEVLSKSLNINDFSQFKAADMYSWALVMWEILMRVELQPVCAEQEGRDGNVSESSGLGDSLSNEGQPRIHRKNESIEKVKSARDYMQPFEGMVQNDPTFEEMRRVVCEEGRRPPMESEWAWEGEGEQNRGFCHMAALITDCWHGDPAARHSALKVKKQLLAAIEGLQVGKMNSQLATNGGKETDSGFKDNNS